MVSNKQEDEFVLLEQYGRPQIHQAGFDGERNLSINCYELRYLRRYLLLVGQWYPKEWNSTKRAFYHVWQFCVILGVWAHFAYSLGCFGDLTLTHQYFKWFPVNAIEAVVWESRWVISHHLGLYYFCVSRHMENFLQDSSLNQALWKETSRYLKRICLAVIVLIFIIPVILRPVELSYSLASEDIWMIVMDTVYLAVDRLVTAPIFFVFVFEAYVLVRVVKGYGERITIWPKDYKNTPGSGMHAAKQHFVKINSLISSVGSNFQTYLALHFLFLLITAFLGVFACAEQLETKVTQNRTYFRADTPRYYKRIKITPSIIKPLVKKIKLVPINSSEPYLQKLLTEKAATKNTISKGILVNVTLKEEITETDTEASRKQILIEVGIEAILKILESIVMYMIPLTLMLRLQTKLSIVRQTILYSDCFEQQENAYLFQDDEAIRIMAEFIETCKGITIFGYKMPLFRAFLLSVLAPFLTALTTFLFSYIHVKRR
ncbi:uncharacterized protein LOC114527162 [Dendronephthya gigantea]|uniref:uncharacterized protein LOC114527162 n=1 Tax=Dendronephthya gigantea TaxID=151771 RepID=UPI00106D9B92|nr:uncharacterized protein LOC114527162 [Dendronephthya gigantea]